MTTLVVGASGATGKHLVEQLVESGQKVKVLIRPTSKIPDHWTKEANISVIREDFSQLNVSDMASHIADCQAVASCLGHNMTLQGMYGKPTKLVTHTVRLLCDAILVNSPERPVKVVLMNTAGNRNRDLDEPISIGQKIVIGLLRVFLPPHPDNEKAADYLRVKIGQYNPHIEWVAVRPDSLINEEKITAYSAHTSPTRSALFNPGKISRINVGHFMAKLITDETIWSKWKGQMPVIYNDTNQA